MMKLIFHINYYHLLFPKTQLCSMIQSGSVKIGISGLDNFVNFQLEMANSYLKKLSM